MEIKPRNVNELEEWLRTVYDPIRDKWSGESRVLYAKFEWADEDGDYIPPSVTEYWSVRNKLDKDFEEKTRPIWDKFWRLYKELTNGN